MGKVPTDTWVRATWEEYLTIIKAAEYEKAKCYYNQGKFRLEMSPLGNDHASDHSIIIYAINLFAALKGIKLNIRDNCTYRKVGFKDVQPDISCYLGDNVEAIPWGTKIPSLDQYPAPNLVIEVGNTSLADDKGEKRLLYEDLGIAEYWIVDVPNVQIIAFSMENGGSRRISESIVLPGLKMEVLATVLRRSRETNHAEVGAWLLKEFQRARND
ncbi:MAG: Uma2 family endonuclease [Gomphosphaeria aponina SAG 52.96 = DSM 107014]|uniref:Uma2 family endonuclease n=1 Tax=Gomphosphaeria aponina SAG 52.96 = DSM 107014 TaxID=1521640 RepID=A0A941JVI5_9CHRO|nr:Uma2 family endonuclease [Gomphosphaeria aponina SAG 52.96 = DSM 107014]